MENKSVTIKIWRETLSKLRLLAGIQEKQMVKILDELVAQELQNRKEASGLWLREQTKIASKRAKR